MTSGSDLPGSTRLLGLDAGERRIGVAISDPDQALAVPLRTLTRDQAGTEFRELERVCREEEIGGFVIGLPLSLSGEAGSQVERTREFAQELKKRLNLPVAFWDERLSSQEADRILAPSPGRDRGSRPRRGPGKRPDKGATDLVAATIILQAYLDSRRGRHFEV